MATLWCRRKCVSSPSETALAPLTIAVRPIATRRLRGCSCSSWFGVAMNSPSSSTPSSAGSSQTGPTVSASGSASCRPIAASTVSHAGHAGSGSEGGG